VHDFGAKLSDPRVAPSVESYMNRVRRRRCSLPAAGPTPGEEAAPGPISINLDLTLACDFRCGHCIDSAMLNGGRHLPLDTVLATLDVLTGRGLRSVILIGGGEPTLYPFFESVIAAVKRLDLACAISSNGAHNQRIAGVASLLGLGDWVRLSLDAGTDDTFQALHRPKKPITLQRVCETAAALKVRAPSLQLGFSFVVMWNSPGQTLTPAATNVHEMPVAAALAREHGFDYISFKPMLVRDSRRAEVVNTGEPAGNSAAIDQIRDCLRSAESAAGERLRVVPSRNLVALLDGSGPRGGTLQPRECHMQQFRHVITPDGVYACPAHRGNPNSLFAGCSGYATPKHFRETARATERQIERFNAAVECRDITCIYHETNWWLERLVEAGGPIQQSVAADFFL
jgi:MoaA/NifB/PqqE/SkfB family radical SAM enzyme